jgi:hypothetical protein
LTGKNAAAARPAKRKFAACLGTEKLSFDVEKKKSRTRQNEISQRSGTGKLNFDMKKKISYESRLPFVINENV